MILVPIQENPRSIGRYPVNKREFGCSRKHNFFTFIIISFFRSLKKPTYFAEWIVHSQGKEIARTTTCSTCRISPRCSQIFKAGDIRLNVFSIVFKFFLQGTVALKKSK